MLTVAEIRRSPMRFCLLAAAIALLAFLILFQQALRDGLIISFSGAVRNQSAPVLVYNVDALHSLQASTIPADLEGRIREVPQVGRMAKLGERTFTVRVDGGDQTDASIIGTDDRNLVHPENLSGGRQPDAPGEAVGSDTDFSVGDRVEVLSSSGADPTKITVVGVAPRIQLSVTPTLFTDLDTFEDATRSANPGRTGPPPNALALAPVAGVSPKALTTAVDAAAPDAEALTRAEAADASPGVAQVRRSFQVIFALYGLVVPLVTGLFFLILTLQKRRPLTLLRAIGARSAVLIGSLLSQVVLIVGTGLVVGTAGFWAVSQVRVRGLTLDFDPATVAAWAAALLALGLLSAVASARRVLRIDPIEATTQGGRR